MAPEGIPAPDATATSSRLTFPATTPVTAVGAQPFPFHGAGTDPICPRTSLADVSHLGGFPGHGQTAHAPRVVLFGRGAWPLQEPRLQSTFLLLKYSIKALVQNDTLLQVKGTGANGSFKLNRKKLEGGGERRGATAPATAPAPAAHKAKKAAPGVASLRRADKKPAKGQKPEKRSHKKGASSKKDKGNKAKKAAASGGKKVKKAGKPSVPKVPKGRK